MSSINGRPFICRKRFKFGEDGAYALTPGYYFEPEKATAWETYSPADGPDAGRVKKAPGAITLQGSFHYSNDGKTIGVITNFYQAVNTKAKGITRTTRPSWSTDSIQRFLVYGGKTGTKIKLAYREIWKNITRPSAMSLLNMTLLIRRSLRSKGLELKSSKRPTSAFGIG